MEEQTSPWDLGVSFLDALDRVLGTPPGPLDRSSILRARDAIVARRAPDLAADTDPEVLGYTATLVAAHAALLGLGVPEILSVLSDAQAEAIAPITGWTRSALDASDDAFLTMRAASRDREDRYFGSSFRFERPRDDRRAYHLHVTGCAFVRICVAEGVPELGPLLCAVDTGWIAAIDPERDGVRFQRPSTIALGHDRCRFLFDRTSTPGEG